jgi:hypothetical protein
MEERYIDTALHIMVDAMVRGGGGVCVSYQYYGMLSIQILPPIE